MSEDEKSYYQQHFPELERKYDSSIIFILSQLSNLKPTGLLGYISSLTWQTGENFKRLREHIFTKTSLAEIVNLPFNVFKDAYVDTGIYVISKKYKKAYGIYLFDKKAEIVNLNNITLKQIDRNFIKAPDYKVILDPISASIVDKINSKKGFTTLGEITSSTQGLAGNMYRLKPVKSAGLYPFLEKGQAHRYVLHIENLAYTDMSEKPSLRVFYETAPKILIRRVISRQDRILCAYTENRMVFKKDINPFILKDPEKGKTLYMLGIMNSRLISYLYINSSSIATKDDFRQTTLAELRKLPVPDIREDQILRSECFKTIVSIVSKYIDTTELIPFAKSDYDKNSLARKIESADRQIDELVYELYGLTKEEIEIVEGTK